LLSFRTYDEKLHFTKPFSLFDPTCTCCFLEIQFHFPALAPPTIQSGKINESTVSETAPLLDNQYADNLDETSQLFTTLGAQTEESIADAAAPLNQEAENLDETSQPFENEFFSPISKSSVATSNDTFQSCNSVEDGDDMHTIRSGSVDTILDKDIVADDESSDGTWNAEDGDSNKSVSSATEGSVHMTEDSSDDEVCKSEDDDEYVGGSESDIPKENDLNESKDFVNSSSLNNSFRD
jgi:hypothetical protein